MESKVFVVKFLQRYDYQLEKTDFKMITGVGGYVPETMDTILTKRKK